MALRISRALLAQMLAHATSSPEREVCGLLFGIPEKEVSEIQPCANVAADPTRSFEVDPAALIAAHKAERCGGPLLVGWYHSHPNGHAVPSACDRNAAIEAGRIWLIVAQGLVRAWRADGAAGFSEVAIDMIG